MPLCEGCGGSYDDKFKFCPYCGRAKPKVPTLNINITSNDVWETCEITLVYNKKRKILLELYEKEWMFQAIAIGPPGKYDAGSSEPLVFGWKNRGRTDRDCYWEGEKLMLIRENASKKLDALITKLVEDGWQSIGRGQEWYGERFRRKVKK